MERERKRDNEKDMLLIITHDGSLMYKDRCSKLYGSMCVVSELRTVLLQTKYFHSTILDVRYLIFL